MLILHIGRHKTGTSSIQYFLHKNREELKRHGVLYPEPVDAVAAHHGIALTLSAGGDVAPYLDMLRGLQPRTNTVLLSSEGFQRLQIKQARNLTGDFPTMTAVYLREQFSHAWSAHVQRVFGGMENRMFTEAVNGPKYHQFLVRWSEISKGNLKVRVHDRTRLIDGDVVADFCQAVLGLDYKLFRPAEVVNKSMGWRAVNFIRNLNECIGRDPTLATVKRVAIHALRDMAPNYSDLMEKPIFEPGFREQFQARFVKNNRRVAAQFLGSDQPLFDLSWRGDSEWNARESLTDDQLKALYEARPALKNYNQIMEFCAAGKLAP